MCKWQCVTVYKWAGEHYSRLTAAYCLFPGFVE